MVRWESNEFTHDMAVEQLRPRTAVTATVPAAASVTFAAAAPAVSAVTPGSISVNGLPDGTRGATDAAHLAVGAERQPPQPLMQRQAQQQGQQPQLRLVLNAACLRPE